MARFSKKPPTWVLPSANKTAIQSTDNPVINYSFAIFMVMVASILSLVFRADLEPTPYFLFWIAVSLGAWYGGFGPGSVGAVLSIVLVDFYLLESTLSIIIVRTATLLLLVFLFSQLRNQRNRWSVQSQLWQVTLSSIGDGIITTDAEGRVTFMNPIAQALTGWQLSEALRHDITEIFPIFSEETGAIVANPVKDVLEKGIIVGLANHTVLRSKDGKEYPIADSGAPIKDYANNIIGTVLVFRDTSQTHGMALALEQTNAQLRAEQQKIVMMFESITDGFFSVDSEFRYSYANRKGQQILSDLAEKQWEELLGKTMWEVFPGTQESAFGEAYRRVMTEKTSESIESFFSPLNRWFTVRVYAASEGISIYFEDISERKLADQERVRLLEERQLAISQKQEAFALLNGLYSSAPIGLAFVDRELRFQQVNEELAQINGLSAEAHIGNTLHILPDIDIELVEAMLRQVLETGESVHFETSGVIPKSIWSLTHWIANYYPVWKDDEIIGIGLIVINITDRKRAEQRIALVHQISAALSVVSTSEQIADTIVQALAVQFSANATSIGRVSSDGKFLEVLATHGITRDRFEEFMLFPLNLASPLTDTIRTQQMMWIENQEQYTTAYPLFADVIRENGTHSVACIPFSINGRVGGGLSLSFQEAKHFTKEDRELLMTIADQCGQALERVYLFDAEQHSRETAELERERLRVTLTSIGDAVIATNNRGSIIFLNAVAQNLTGWPIEEAVGQSLVDVFNIVNEETLEPVESPFDKVMREGGIIGLANHTFLINRQGKKIPIDDSGAPIRGEDGVIDGVIIVFRDITERKLTEQRTLILQELAKALSASLTVQEIAEVIIQKGLQALGGDGGGLFNLSKDGGSLELIKSMGFLADFEENFRTLTMSMDNPMPDAVQTGDLIWLQNPAEVWERYPSMRDPAQDPETADGAVICLPLIIEERTIGGIYLVFMKAKLQTDEETDLMLAISQQCAQALERARLYEAEAAARLEAEEANKIKVKFIGMITHELRTPLTTIKGFTTTLQAEDVIFSPSEQREFIDIINLESDRLTELVEQLLNVSSMQAGTLQITLETQEFAGVIDEVKAQLIVIAADYDLSIEIDPALPAVPLDKHRIGQVILNLTTNAVKFSPQGSRIICRAVRHEDGIQVSISDEGRGIPQEQKEIAFEAFRQLSATGEGIRSRQGVGLGLAICKGIIDAHHGKIWIEDNTPTGTVVTFTLPNR